MLHLCNSSLLIFISRNSYYFYKNIVWLINCFVSEDTTCRKSTKNVSKTRVLRKNLTRRTLLCHVRFGKMLSFQQLINYMLYVSWLRAGVDVTISHFFGHTCDIRRHNVSSRQLTFPKRDFSRHSAKRETVGPNNFEAAIPRHSLLTLFSFAYILITCDKCFITFDAFSGANFECPYRVSA